MQKSTILFSILLLLISTVIYINVNKNTTLNNHPETHNSQKEPNSLNSKNSQVITITSPSLSIKETEEKPSVIKEKEIINNKNYVHYLEYRKKNYNKKTIMQTQYLNYQKKLALVREGGVQSKLNKEKAHVAMKLQKQHKSYLMSHKKNEQNHLMRQKKLIQQKQIEMQSLREKQILQTKYRGEL